MTRMRQRWAGLRAGLALSMLAGAWVAGNAQGAQPVPALDLTKFTGTWYEIARLPNKAEKKCVGDALALYALEDKPGQFSVVNSCSLKDGTPQVRNDSGKQAKNATDGRLQISYFVFFSHKLWVIALDPTYQWAVVGTPNHKQLWVYARTVTLDAGVMAGLQSKAAAQGFDVAKLVMTPQSDRTRRLAAVTPAASGGGGVAR